MGGTTVRQQSAVRQSSKFGSKFGGMKNMFSSVKKVASKITAPGFKPPSFKLPGGLKNKDKVEKAAEKEQAATEKKEEIKKAAAAGEISPEEAQAEEKQENLQIMQAKVTKAKALR